MVAILFWSPSEKGILKLDVALTGKKYNPVEVLGLS